MTLVKFEPFRELESVFGRMNDFFSEASRGLTIDADSYLPHTDILEDDEQLTVITELPGVDKQDISIKITEDGVLTISGEKSKETKQEGQKSLRLERQYGKFDRSIALPENIDESGVKAEYKDGVLTLTLPKVAPPKPREIEVDIS